MNKTPNSRLHVTSYLINAVFLVLTIALQILLTLYWFKILEPELRSKANIDAKLIAEGQASQLADALTIVQDDTDMDIVIAAIDNLLLYRQVNSDEPMYMGISVELDAEYFARDYLERGQLNCPLCFQAEIELYSPDTLELMGVATFYVSDYFYQSVALDIRNKLVILGAISLLLLLTAWAASFYLLRSLSEAEQRRIASEMALTKNQAKYHRLVSNLSQYFVYTRDASGDITSASDNIKELFGYTGNEMQQIVALLTDNPINQIALHYYGRAFHEAAQLEFEAEIYDKYGERRWLLLSEMSIEDEHGNFISIEGLGRDITKQKRSEADLRLAKEEAEVANQAKGQFLANMSHEIRTPLNAIIGNTYLALRSNLDTKQQNLINRVDSSAHVLLGLVNDILDISKIDAGKMDLESIPFYLEDVLANLSSVTAIQATNKGLDIIYSVDPNIPQPLLGDPLRLGQILLNLISNAIKFTEHGEILLKIALQDTQDEQIQLTMSVKDDGIGIAEDKQHLLFSSFNQVDNSMTRKYGGTGLGLSISAKLVNMMGGKIGVESEFGRGSTFYFSAQFRQPQDDQNNATIKESVANTGELLQGKHIFIVDDSTTSCFVLTEMLKIWNCRVTTCHSGQDCIDFIGENEDPIDLLIVDWRMPNIDGSELIQAIQTLTLSYPMPPVIMLSAFSNDEDYVQTTSDLPLAGHLSKPLTFNKLSHVIQNAFSSNPQAHQSLNQLDDNMSFSAVGRKVLVAEDNKLNQEVIISLLEDVEAEVVIANNGLEAIQRAKEQRFDLILMDIQMPEMDGLTAAKNLLNEQQIKVPIIAMTAHASQEDRKRSKEAGMIDHLTKPIDVDLFYQTLDNYMTIDGLPEHNQTAQPEFPLIAGINIPSALKRLGYKETLLLKLLNDFHHEYRLFTTRYYDLSRHENTSELLHLVHKLKGEAGNISANEAHQIAGKVESQLRLHGTADKEDETRLNTVLNTLLENISGALQHYSAEPPKQDDTKVTELNLQSLLPLIEQLDNMLQTQQLDATDVGEDILAAIPSNLCEAQKQALSDSLEQLDFEQARQDLAELNVQISKHESQ